MLRSYNVPVAAVQRGATSGVHANDLSERYQVYFSPRCIDCSSSGLQDM